MRDQLEVLAAVEAAKTAPSRPDDVKEMYRLFDKMTETIGEPTVTLKWNWELHRCISRMGANKILSGIYMTLLEYIEQELDVVASATDSDRPQRILKTHRDIVGAGRLGSARGGAARPPPAT